MLGGGATVLLLLLLLLLLVAITVVTLTYPHHLHPPLLPADDHYGGEKKYSEEGGASSNRLAARFLSSLLELFRFFWKVIPSLNNFDYFSCFINYCLKDFCFEVKLSNSSSNFCNLLVYDLEHN